MWTLLLLACPQSAPETLAQGAGPAGVPLASLQPASAQQELILEAGVLRIDGALSQPCPGRVRVDVLTQAQAEQPLTTLALWPGARRFQILAPAGQALWLTAVCDANSDGLLDTEHDQVTEILSLGQVAEGEVREVRLVWTP